MLCKIYPEASKLDRSVLVKKCFYLVLPFKFIKIHEQYSNTLKASAHCQVLIGRCALYVAQLSRLLVCARTIYVCMHLKNDYPTVKL